jgi:inosine-uridine nucleoside N-ribohydrolase
MSPTVIDTDPGIDDALALFLAWSSPELDLQAVTTVAGNVTVAQATINLLRLIHLNRTSSRPTIAVGAAQPLCRKLVTAQGYHGGDGLGDLEGWPDVEIPSTPPAADVLVEAARRHRSALTLIALGPLTNVALALRADAAAMAAIGRAVIMAGAVDVPGNVTPTAEFNAHVDPDALREVLGSAMTIDLVSLDATRQAVLTLGDLEAALEHADRMVAERLRAITERGLAVDLARGGRGMIMHDPLAVALAIDTTLARWEAVRLTVGLEGETRRTTGPPNCRLARAVDTARFRTLLVERLCRRG